MIESKAGPRVPTDGMGCNPAFKTAARTSVITADWLRDRARLSPEIGDRWLWALQGRGWIRVNHMPFRRQRSVVVTRQGRSALKAERERLQALAAL